MSCLSQATLVLSKNDDCPIEEWFQIKGRKFQGVSIYIGSPDKVEYETKRIFEYYNQDPELWDPDVLGQVDYEITLENGRMVFIQITNLDIFEWTRSIYILIR